jgi:mannan endo-1,4-beta-mannosidase
MRRNDFELPERPMEIGTAAEALPKRLPWIHVAGCYFATESGEAWTPVGQNDAITWPELSGLFRRRDVAAVERHLRWMAGHGVTCLRLMLEYAEVRHRYFERPVGRFAPAMVQLWDDLFELCERCGLRILLTPFDTFWTWRRWSRHPYNRLNGGCLDQPSRILLCRETREAIKGRLSFAVERWGDSGALFAWDLWNEIHYAQAENSADVFSEFIHDLSRHVRALEMRLYGRARPQTVSLFGPELWWRPELPLREPIFRHPDLDFASLHVYQEGTIDDPQDTVAPAVGVGQIVRLALGEIADGRPFLDSEHGPIHAFKDKHITLPERFDDEYFRHMQWAHLASGGAGGGMRWPNRKPHVLTPGMRRAQHGLAGFLPLIDWPSFHRINLNQEIEASATMHVFACGDRRQAVIWLLRNDALAADGTMAGVAPIAPRLRLPGLEPGLYQATLWDTSEGCRRGSLDAEARDSWLELEVPPFAADIAIAVRRV